MALPADPGGVLIEAHHDHAHEAPRSFWKRWVFSKDHKVIGIQFLFSGILWALVGGGLAILVRTRLGWPAGIGGKISPETYNMAFTMHASVMIFLVIIPTLSGAFGNFLIPLMIGARDMAFPTLNMISYWVMWPAFGVFIASFLVQGGAAAAGWTAYPPLSVLEGGTGQTLWAIGVILVGWSSIMGAVNYITTIIALRAPGMSLFRMPLSVWALFITAILQLLATPVLGSAMMCLLAERGLHSSFFLPAGIVHGGAVKAYAQGQPLLWQHLFWFYSHPAVYIMILPAMGFVSDILTTFARKPLFGYRPMVYSMSGIAGLGFIVWGHHMFMSGMNPYLGMTFMISTMMIALPSAVKVFNWLGTLWGGQLQLTTAMCFACAFVGMFVIGGLSGIFMAATPVDVQIHDTYFIVAHIHYVLFAGTILGIFGATYYWFPKMFGRAMNERIGKWHFWLTFLLLNGTFFPMHIIGMRMQRRIADPLLWEGVKPFQWMNVLMSVSAILLFTSQILFFVNLWWGLRRGPRAGDNPYKANSLEWQTSSPPPFENFREIPTVFRGPYEYASPEVEEDYLPQTRDLRTAAKA